MGQGWSKVRSGHLEASDNLPRLEAAYSPIPTLPQSQTTTEASSSIPLYQGSTYIVSAADVELSSLHEQEEDEPQDRGKETQTTPTPSTSQLESPLEEFLQAPEKSHLKKNQASPSVDVCKFGPLNVLDLKPRASRIGKGPVTEIGAEAEGTPSTSQFSPSQDLDPQNLQSIKMDDEDSPSQSVAAEPDEIEMNKVEELIQPQSSAQKLLLFELDRKRKAPAGLPSLAVECMGASRMKLKARTSLDIPSGGGSRSEAVVELGTGDLMVGRRIRKVIKSRDFCEGRISAYNVALQSYKILYDNGKEEAMEWLDLEPCLVDQSNNNRAPREEGKETQTLRKSLRNVQRFKKVDELTYTKRQSRRRRRKR